MLGFCVLIWTKNDGNSDDQQKIYVSFDGDGIGRGF